MKKRFNKLQENYINKKSHDALILCSEENNNVCQNKKLIENEELAWSQHEKLENVKRKIIEMDNVGIEIMNDLEHQSGIMKGVSSKLNDMNVNIENSNSLINRMIRRENRNKMIIVILAVLIIFSFLIILCVKFI